MSLLKFAKIYMFKYLKISVFIFFLLLTTKGYLQSKEKNTVPGFLGSEQTSLFEENLASEIYITTREKSPLLIQNTRPIKQQFNNKVFITIGGEDGDLFYAKEVEENSNLWQIDWINQPDFEKPLGGINNNSNNYKASINIKDVSGDIETIQLFVDVVDIDENLKKNLKKSDNKVDGKIVNNYSEVPRKKNKFFSLNDLTLGLAEKGGFLGIAKNVGKKNQFELGYNYLNLDISRFFTTNSKVKIKNSSFKFALRRFFTKKSTKQGFYLEGSGDLSKLDIYSDYSLTNEDSSFGSLSVSCSACGTLYVNSEDRYNLIPSILLGYRRNISKRIALDLKAGVQYVNVPKFTWKAIQQDGTTYYPPFIYTRIEEEANDEVGILNNKLEDIPKFLPTVGINLIFRF